MQPNIKPILNEPVDQRIHERIGTILAGKLFVPAEELTVDCWVMNLSAGGARAYCVQPLPPESSVTFYVDGFGRFDCVVTRCIEGELGLRFVCKEAKRQRLLQDIASFVKSGATSLTRLRRHMRKPSNSFVYFQRPNGESVRCDVLDISLQASH